MDYRDIQKLKAFFLALKDSGFKQDIKQIPSFAIVDGQRTPVDKAYCLQLLRKFPQFQGDEFKDDNTIIKYLSDPINRKFLLGQFTQEQQIELTNVLAEKPVPEGVTGEQPGGGETSAEQGLSAQTPVTAATGTAGMPGLPSTPSISSTPRITRIIHNIPQTPEPPKPEISIANSSGVVREAGDPSKLVKATRVGEITEPGQPSKLVTADSSGRIVGGQGAETPPSKIYIANKSGAVIGEHPIKSPSFLKSAGQRLGSTGSIAFKKITTNMTKGFSNILGGVAGGGGRFLGGAGIGSLNALVRFSNQVSRGSLVKGPPAKFWLIILAAFLLVGTIAAVTPSGQQTPTREAGPLTGVIGLDYTLPLKDTSTIRQDIKDQVKATFSGAKLEYWDDPIVKRSVAEGWNPALVLALWIEETGASQTTLLKNGGSEIPVDGKLSNGHLGCAPLEDQTIDESLDCLFKFGATFTNDQFPQFMAAYSSGPPGNPFLNNPDFPANIKFWYSKLVPTSSGAIQPIITTAVASCPIPQGAISTPSYQADPVQGHCGSKYGYSCRCGTEGRRAKAIDVPTVGQAVVLPTIEGQQVTWHLVVGPYPVDNQEGGGVGYTFETSLGSDKWHLDMLHLKLLPISQGVDYSSDTSIGGAAAEHVHMTIGKNIINPKNPGTESTDCDPGWLASDFMCR